MLDTYIRATSSTLLWSMGMWSMWSRRWWIWWQPIGFGVRWSIHTSTMGWHDGINAWQCHIYGPQNVCLQRKTFLGSWIVFKRLNEDFKPSSWRFDLEDKNLNTMNCCWTDHTSAHPYIEKQMDAKFSMKQSIFVCWSLKTNGK